MKSLNFSLTVVAARRLAFRLMAVLAAGLLLLAAPAWAQRSESVRTDQVSAQLLAYAPQGVAAGRTVWLGLQITHNPNWHSYWKNPGDSGLPTALNWQLPPGASAGEIQWPAPKKFFVGTLANYGYENTVLLPVPVTLGQDYAGGPLEVQLQANWLVCHEVCIPEEGSFSVRVSGPPSDPNISAAFADAAERQPKPQAAGQSFITPQDNSLLVQVQGLPADWQGQTLAFFPEMGSVIEPGAAWQQRWDGAVWQAEVPYSAMRAESPALLPVVLVREGDIGQGQNALGGLRLELPARGDWPALPTAGQANEISPALQAALDANAARAAAAPAAADATGWGFAVTLLGALLGGLLLNLMPCVFPVLAIKVLAFAQHGADRAQHRRAGAAYSAGVVLSFVALGAVLLALRAAGEQVGWGFQLQSPMVVAALAVLFTVIALNLAGLFEFAHILPSRLATLQARNPTVDAFLTGVLAVAVASPCTAPFMGAALGLAVGLPAVQALAVFALLGVGLALPYALASAWPGLARALPRPGPWMDTLRRFMAFPMLATVVWLLWVLGLQTSIDGVVVLLGLLIALAWLLWAWSLRGRARLMLVGLALITVAVLAAWLAPQITRTAETPLAAASDQTEMAGWQAWSPERMAAWQADGRVVLVDYTAAWCVTCQFNKKTTLSDKGLIQELSNKGIVLARADWTRRDPAITQALAALGRNGVPAYAFYRNGQPLKVLSEIISVQDIREAAQGL